MVAIGPFRLIGSQNRDFGGRTRHSFGGKGSNDDALGTSAKQFGIGKYNIIVYFSY